MWSAHSFLLQVNKGLYLYIGKKNVLMQLPNANRAHIIMLVEHTVSHIYVYKGFIYLFILLKNVHKREKFHCWAGIRSTQVLHAGKRLHAGGIFEYVFADILN